MSYIRKTLLPSEKVLCQTGPHYIVLASMAAWVIIIFLFMFGKKPDVKITFFPFAINDVYLYLLLLMGIFQSIKALIIYAFSEYVITNKRIIMKTGFISRQSLETFLERVEGISVEQSILGRILGYGSVTVGGTGGTQNKFNYVDNPIEFRNNVQQQIDNRRVANAQPITESKND